MSEKDTFQPQRLGVAAIGELVQWLVEQQLHSVGAYRDQFGNLLPLSVPAGNAINSLPPWYDTAEVSHD